MYSIVIHSNTSTDPPPIKPRLFFATIPTLRRSVSEFDCASLLARMGGPQPS